MEAYLEGTYGKHYGKIGTPTNFIFGSGVLHVGDVVKVYNDYCRGEKHFVCKNERYGDFIDGIAGIKYNKETEKLDDGWVINLVKKYYELEDNEKYNYVSFIQIKDENERKEDEKIKLTKQIKELQEKLNSL